MHTAVAERELAALHITLTAANLEPGSALHAWLRDGRALRGHLNALFARAAADGTARSDRDPAAPATDVAAFIEGAHLLWLLDRDEVDLTAVHRSYFEDRRLA
ncbi:hypothetical protein OG920_45095 [Streptomyces europaeiscabiei]|uniref:hypothetical protein n=1 Tax=Streptomyces TaxID=1883 RepID=UPI00211B5ACF|nr:MULTISPECIES: hypothetical protein [Streptomyces]MDX3589451.1 hypothetical protein [Streptomyces europaeiscabiei]MDX3616165.1 hypothetical protein [Streptomyces europaeiscabiei]MDX3636962.1 hypothetical protein [Streptomyces europaeiscabiei]MDX3652814.1 hypothetical protein [Streptomyces europaeiscabiei]WUD37999.1 hypothetical protein OG858_45805 [Streptomyces europaeiscabiei]